MIEFHCNCLAVYCIVLYCTVLYSIALHHAHSFSLPLSFSFSLLPPQYQQSLGHRAESERRLRIHRLHTGEHLHHTLLYSTQLYAMHYVPSYPTLSCSTEPALLLHTVTNSIDTLKCSITYLHYASHIIYVLTVSLSHDKFPSST